MIFSYGGSTTDTLAHLRHAKYKEATFKDNIEPESLPPTERAVFFHSLRVHLQVSQWKYLNMECLEPIDCGWKLENDVMSPVKTDLDPAPKSILQSVRCKCKLTSKNPCSTPSCSCRKSGLSCVATCGKCQWEQCENSDITPVDENNDIEEDDRNIFELFESFM